MDSKTPHKPITMRNHWFAHVAKTRKKLTKARKEAVSHREAMREASLTWAPVKDKIVRKNTRMAKRDLRMKKTASRSK